MKLFDDTKLAGWIIVNRWETFQHYRDRRPPWIKNYLDLLDEPDYLRLTVGERSLLHGIWLMYASHHGQLPFDARYLSRQLNIRATSLQLEALNDAGFIRVAASKPLALSEQVASTHARPRARGEAETEREKENPLPREAGQPDQTQTPRTRGTNPRAEGTNPRDQGTNPRARGLNPRELARYTGCKATRGTHGAGHVPHPLGTDKPPSDWKHPQPSEREVRTALAKEWIEENHGAPTDDDVRAKLAWYGVNGEDEIELRELAADKRQEQT